jgi:DNA mismatch endonuclease (patch repair protein)
MADVFTKKKRSQVMAAIRSRGNKDTELRLAAILRAAGITGWRRHRPLPGRPDFAFYRQRLAVFVDGCFWHGCPRHGRNPGSNRDYWLPKLRRNRARDRSVRTELSKRGWRVVRLWEHELADGPRAAARIAAALKPRLRPCRRPKDGFKCSA